jgi:nitroimidazol reductase NimA-like FMN-containing flavoprotein (pyridoxamine 5'-phosphate oxidase superfamily)
VSGVTATTSPRADRPEFPQGYGLPSTTDGLLAWADIEARLVDATTYWLATTRADGRPHVVPRWGVWLDGCFWYDGAATTRHAQNAEVNPACALHLEDGTRAVIVEGETRATRADPDGLGARLADAFRKYHDHGYSPGADAWAGPDGGGLRVLTPLVALVWVTFPTDATRFRFG